jgi:hypothetical protein
MREIKNVETTPATTPDDHMVESVHASLAQRGLLPAEHLVDKGYTDAPVLVDSQQTYGVTLIGPVADDPSWQARTGTGFDKSQFGDEPALVAWPEFAAYKHFRTPEPCIGGVYPLKRLKIHRYMNRGRELDIQPTTLYIRRHVPTNDPTATQTRS